MDKTELKKIGQLSLCIALALIGITVVVGLLAFAFADAHQLFVLQLGFPHPWLVLSHLGTTYTPASVTIHWANLIMDFILYGLLVFCLTFFGEVVIQQRRS